MEHLQGELYPKNRAHRDISEQVVFTAALIGTLAFTLNPTQAADLAGSIQGAGQPIAGSTVTLFAANADTPKQLAQARSGADGRFSMTLPGSLAADSSLYLVAQGGQSTANQTAGNNPAIALMTVLGSKPPARSRSTK